MRIVITGATGLLGRNLLFEIIKQNLNRLDTVQIVVLGRNKDGTNIYERIRKIVLTDGLSYITPSKENVELIKQYCQTGIKAIYTDLDKENIGLKNEDYIELKQSTIDYFFHLAALTDLRSTPKIEQALNKTNIFGTRQILELISTLKVKEFCYTGTAYSCGGTTGNIEPDYINHKNKFRNPYEKTKLEAELLVREFAKKNKLKCRYFRPSVTCGRLIEPPIGAVNKFDVFYGWATFFFQLKLSKLTNGGKVYTEPVRMEMRICYNPKSGLNIVPADFAAKIMYQASIQNDPGESYYLVNEKETPHEIYIPLMLKTLNIIGPRQVDKIPNDMNQLERVYYKTAGKVFTPYITSQPILFDTHNLKVIMQKAKLKCPPVNEKTFPLLMEYAKKQDFGLADKNILQNKL